MALEIGKKTSQPVGKRGQFEVSPGQPCDRPFPSSRTSASRASKFAKRKIVAQTKV